MEKFEIDKKLFVNVILGLALFQVVLYTVQLFNNWLSWLVNVFRFDSGFGDMILIFFIFLLAAAALTFVFMLFFTKREFTNKSVFLILGSAVGALFILGIVGAAIERNIVPTITVFLLAAALAIILGIYLMRQVPEQKQEKPKKEAKEVKESA